MEAIGDVIGSDDIGIDHSVDDGDGDFRRERGGIMGKMRQAVEAPVGRESSGTGRLNLDALTQ